MAIIIVLSSCESKSGHRVKKMSSKDSLNLVIKNREKSNGVIYLSEETMKELATINNELLNKQPGEKIANEDIYCFGESRFICPFSTKLGHEKNNYSSFSTFVSPHDNSISCYSSEGCTGSFSKTIDTSGRVIDQYWQHRDTLKGGKKIVICYNQHYDVNDCTFIENYTVYELTSADTLGHRIKNLCYEHFNLKKRPELPVAEFTSVGGTPEFFVKKFVTAFKKEFALK